jgi:hypothetical protein
MGYPVVGIASTIDNDLHGRGIDVEVNAAVDLQITCRLRHCRKWLLTRNNRIWTCSSWQEYLLSKKLEE